MAKRHHRAHGAAANMLPRFCSNTRGCCIEEILLSPFQKNGEK
jgi:hypothetical protein